MCIEQLSLKSVYSEILINSREKYWEPSFIELESSHVIVCVVNSRPQPAQKFVMIFSEGGGGGGGGGGTTDRFTELTDWMLNSGKML